MLKTIILLISTLVGLPIVAFYYDKPLDVEQQEMLVAMAKFMVGIALTCFVVSEITRNCSRSHSFNTFILGQQ